MQIPHTLAIPASDFYSVMNDKIPDYVSPVFNAKHFCLWTKIETYYFKLLLRFEEPEHFN